jgi:NTE family protein
MGEGNLPRIGLALGGGGARGLAHIGVLKVLEEARIPIDYLSGTSMGGIIAAAYAAGLPVQNIEERALKLSHVRELVKLMDVSSRRRGLLEGTRVRAYLKQLFGEEMRIEALRLPLALVAVDLTKAQKIVFRNGPLLTAVMATSAFPGLFAPICHEGRRLVDGGVLDNVPMIEVREMGADVVIAVDVQVNPLTASPLGEVPGKPQWPVPVPEFFMDFYWSILMMMAQVTTQQVLDAKPDVLLVPPIPNEITMFLGFPHADKIIAAGEIAARNALPNILKILAGSD